MHPRPRANRNILLTIFAALALYLVGNASVALWDRDEPRYAQTSRQMLDTGDWVVPMLLDQVREKKPVFIYWCQAAAMKVLGTNTFAARLPSAIGVALTLAILAFTLRRAVGDRRAYFTMFIFATSGLTIAAAKMCITDGVLILFITISQLCLAAILLGNTGWLVFITGGIAIGLGILTKGPVVLGVMLTTLVALIALNLFDRRQGRVVRPLALRTRPSISPFKWIVAAILIVIVLAPWLYAIEQRLDGYILRVIRGEVIDRMKSAQEGHKGPPGFYLLLSLITFFPWSLLLPATILSAWRRRHIPHIRIALAAVIGPWVMFEIIATKLPHYVLPTYPALAFLAADMLIVAARRKAFADRIFLHIVLVWACIIVIVSLAPWAALPVFGAPASVAMIFMILLPLLAMEYGRNVWVHFRAKRPLDAAIAMGVGMMILIAVLYAGYLPHAAFLRISPQVADVLNQNNATRLGDAIMIDYKETSLPFYQQGGGTIRAKDDNFFTTTPALEWPKWLVITESAWKNLPDPVKNRYDPLRTLRGLNPAGKDSAKQHLINVMVLRKSTQTETPEPNSKYSN